MKKPMIFAITKEQIDKCFEGKDHQADVVVALYKLAFPNWNSIAKIDGWPKVNKAVNEYIFRKFIEFDEKHHPNVIKGGRWMNNGFSTLDSDHLDWQIDISECKLTLFTMKEEVEN